MSSEKTVSVYMPTHNRPELLKRAIASVQSQSYPVTELIVVDDGSSDNTWELLNELKGQDPKLVIIKHDTPRGACAARNSAIRVAKGEFITGLDDDDEFLPEHIENLMANWDEKFSCVAASMLNDNGETRVRQGKETGVIRLSQLLHYNRLGNQILTLTSRMQEIGGFDESLPAFQDYDCWIRMLAHFGEAYKLAQPSYVLHTAHELNRISNNNTKRLKALELFVSKHKEKMGNGHLKSVELTRKRIEGESISLVDMIRFINPGNYRAVISAFLSSLRASN